MAGRELKQLFRAFGSGDELAFRRAAQAIIDEEEAKQHVALARDLRRLLSATGTDGHGSTTVVLPDPPRDSTGDWPLADVRHPQVDFGSLVLHDQTAELLQEISAEAHAHELLQQHGLPPRRRFLFYGAPGCGKTSAAEALAGQLGVPLVVVRIDSVVSSYLGETASNLRRILDYAHEGRFVILFDEFDALGRLRDDVTEHGEIKRVVNAFLQMLDTYRGPSILVAATNHEQLLDTALWRRFEEVLPFDRPTVHQIRRLLSLRLGSVPKSGINVKDLAPALKGLSHAAVEHAVSGAFRHSVLDGRVVVTHEDMVRAIHRTRQRPW